MMEVVAVNGAIYSLVRKTLLQLELSLCNQFTEL
jgi:hypothetical protein